MESYKDLVESFAQHPTNAQIFFKIDEKQTTLERALAILEGVGLGQLHRQIIQREDGDWALIRISSNDMREATLKLSEAGFGEVLGINPKPQKTSIEKG